MPATCTYSPPLPKIPAGDIFRTDPRGLPVPDPCPHTYGVRVGPCRASATEPCRPTACTGEGSFAVVGIAHRPFRHTHSHPRPRPTTTVWRNLQQHPQCAATTTTLHSQFSILNSSFTHTFSTKERDTETGLSHFGSRYYSSDLSIWLSVDPMSGKYPHQSNYVYCSNNPIKIVDPDGDDEWEVNEITGRIKHYSNDRPDKLFVTTADGQRKDDISPLDVDRTIMGQILSDETQTAFTAMNKREEFNKMFDYLADNTFVEWSHIGVSYYIEDKYGGTTNTFDMLFTIHQFTSCNLRGNLENFVGSGVLDFHKHSHPNKYLGLNPYYKAVYTMTSHIPSRNDLANKNSYPFQGIPFKSYFLLRNGKRNIIY